MPKWRLSSGDEMTMAVGILHEDTMVTMLLLRIQRLQMHWLDEALRVVSMLNHLFMLHLVTVLLNETRVSSSLLSLILSVQFYRPMTE